MPFKMSELFRTLQITFIGTPSDQYTVLMNGPKTLDSSTLSAVGNINFTIFIDSILLCIQ
jgi:hypothetical protein